MVYDLCDGQERNLDDFSVSAFNLDARSRQRLGRLHAADDATYAFAVGGDNLHVVLAVERAQGCEGFSYFHYNLPRFLCLIDENHYTAFLPFSESSPGASNKMQPALFGWRIGTEGTTEIPSPDPCRE